MSGGDGMTTQATADLVAEVQARIRERGREGALGLAELIGPAEWADLVPQLEPSEVAVLIQWLPDDEIAMILEELAPSEAARILRSLSANEAGELLGEMDPDDAADVVEQLPDEDVHEILIRMRPEDAAEIRDITEDDVADVLQEEATEDIERLGGSQPLNLPYRLASVGLLVRKRVGWLLLLFLAEAYTGTVLRNFEDELQAAVALSFFIPLLIG